MSITKKLAGTAIAALVVGLSVGAIDAYAQTASPSPKPVSKSAVKPVKPAKTAKTKKILATSTSTPVKPTLKGLSPSVTHETTHTMTGVGAGAGAHTTTKDAGTVPSEANASNPSQPPLGTTGFPR